MNPSDPNEKGSALERATRAIEEMVIRAQPGLAQAPFSIQGRQTLTKGGQRFEIDVLVRINEASPYETQHFFECKNWKDPVDRNAVTIFARKMTALGAARGTIIGRSFTKDAELEAQQTPNLELVTFTDDFFSPLTTLGATHFAHHFTRFLITAHRAPETPETHQPDFLKAPCSYEGRPIPFTEFAHGLASQYLTEIGAFSQNEGTHKGTQKPAFEFDPGELIVGNWDVRVLQLDFDYEITLEQMRLVSVFSIEKRGRFARLEAAPDPVTGTNIAIEILGPP